MPRPLEGGMYYVSQMALVVTFLHVPTVVPSPAVHTNSAPAESM